MSNKIIGSSITVIIPTLNEEHGIGSTILELKKYLENAQYLVVDGNSVDGTVKQALLHNAYVLQQEGVGKGLAIAKAFNYVHLGTRYVVLIDADFTYPADNIYRMIEILEKNADVGMVIGNRFNNRLELKSMGSIFYFGNRLIALMHNWLNGIDLKDPLTGLRVIRWEILKNWKPKSEGFDIEVELNCFIDNQMNYLIKEIPIHYRKRIGRKKLSLKHGFTILKRILLHY